MSLAERNFIRESFVAGRRIDGRISKQCRCIVIRLGMKRGTCIVELGNTKVFACVSCQVVEPKTGRPTEGYVYINVEVSPMTAPNLEPGRAGTLGNEVTRLIERCIKEARCVDTESLCIVAGEQVWEIKLDVHLLDHDGGLIDAAMVASVTALRHFRRPDVTVIGEEVTIHTVEEKDPVPLNLYHMPICVTVGYAGGCLVLDPVDREEKCLDGKVIFGLNSHHEICTLHCAGDMLLKKTEILRCLTLASERVQFVTEKIKETLVQDAEARENNQPIGFHLQIPTDCVTALFAEATREEPSSSGTEGRRVTVVDPASKSPTIPVPAMDTSVIDRKRGKVKTLGKAQPGDFGIISDRSTPPPPRGPDEDNEVSENFTAERAEIPDDLAEADKLEEEVAIKKKRSKEPKVRNRRAGRKKPVISDDVAELLNDIEEDVMVLDKNDIS